MTVGKERIIYTMKKRSIAVLVSAPLILGLLSCSSESDNGTNSTATQIMETEMTEQDDPLEPIAPSTIEDSSPPKTEGEEGEEKEQKDPAVLASETEYEPIQETPTIKEINNLEFLVNNSIEYSKIALMRTQNSLVREYAAVSIDKNENMKKKLQEIKTNLGYDPNFISSQEENNSYETIILLMDLSDEEFDKKFIETALKQEKQVNKVLQKLITVSSSEEKEILEETTSQLTAETSKNIDELNKIKTRI